MVLTASTSSKKKDTKYLYHMCLHDNESLPKCVKDWRRENCRMERRHGSGNQSTRVIDK